MSVQAYVKHRLQEEELHRLHRLRELRRERRRAGQAGMPLGERIADTVAATVGSWRFIITQSALLILWMVLNVTAFIQHWDPYPFILLNLALSFQAAYAAPIIMMSQNRQAAIDRRAAEHDYQINLKAELEIELLHQKMDQLRETEVLRLTETVQTLLAELRATRAPSGTGAPASS